MKVQSVCERVIFTAFTIRSIVSGMIALWLVNKVIVHVDKTAQQKVAGGIFISESEEVKLEAHTYFPDVVQVCDFR